VTDKSELPAGSEKGARARWRAADAYVFDIDGTLLVSRDRVHWKALHQAMLEAYRVDTTIEGIPYHGMTDLGILRAALARVGIAGLTFDMKLPQALAVVRREVEANRQWIAPEVCPGIFELLRQLQAEQKLLGVSVFSAIRPSPGRESFSTRSPKCGAAWGRRPELALSATLPKTFARRARQTLRLLRSRPASSARGSFPATARTHAWRPARSCWASSRLSREHAFDRLPVSRRQVSQSGLFDGGVHLLGRPQVGERFQVAADNLRVSPRRRPAEGWGWAEGGVVLQGLAQQGQASPPGDAGRYPRLLRHSFGGGQQTDQERRQESAPGMVSRLFLGP
jgi:hypothetical protein